MRLLLSQTVFATLYEYETTYDGIDFLYSIQTTDSAVVGIARYLKNDSATTVSVEMTVYEYQIANPEIVMSKTYSASSSAHTQRATSVTHSKTVGYDFYFVESTNTVRNSAGSLTKQIRLDI